ncbi:ARM repeat-containing protein [Rhodotorula sp. JG-1b]|nr:ARM repeat-containing protein [Rhodotorula sp. JG-1b]
MLANANRPSHIETLISGVDRYNPSNVHLLEDYLQQQLANDQYDLLANLALLKLYQFNPAILSPPATLSVLFLSLVHAPFSPDFSLAWALLSDSFVVGAALPPAAPDSDDDDDEEEQTPARPAEPHGEKETASRLFELSKLLQARKLRAFWTLFRQGQEEGASDREDEVRARVKGLVEAAQGCEERVRASMAHEMERSFRSIKKSTLEGFLGISDPSQLGQLASARGWTVRDSEVQLPANDSNTPKGQVTHERIEIEQLTRLLGRTQT